MQIRSARLTYFAWTYLSPFLPWYALGQACHAGDHPGPLGPHTRSPRPLGPRLSTCLPVHFLGLHHRGPTSPGVYSGALGCHGVGPSRGFRATDQVGMGTPEPGFDCSLPAISHGAGQITLGRDGQRAGNLPADFAQRSKARAAGDMPGSVSGLLRWVYTPAPRPGCWGVAVNSEGFPAPQVGASIPRFPCSLRRSCASRPRISGWPARLRSAD